MSQFRWMYVMLLASLPIAAAEPVWMADGKTGCKVLNPFPQPGEGVEWSGTCVDGFATGVGTLTWLKEGKPTERFNVVEGSGLVMRDGRLEVNIPDDAVAVEEKDCEGRYATSSYRLRLRKPLDLSQWLVVEPLLRPALDFAVECGKPQNVSVLLEDLDGKWVVRARAYPKASEIWFEYENKLYSAQKAALEAEARAIDSARWEAQRAKRQELEAALKKADDARRNDARNAFASKHGVSAFVGASELFSNPFKWQGKTVAVLAQFRQMVAPETALFCNGDDCLVATGLRNEAIDERFYMVAGRVLGNTPAKIPVLGEILVPHLRWAGGHKCLENSFDSGCGEFWPR
jgi:hypothetical protein